MSEDGINSKSPRVYINDKGMTVKVVSFEDTSPPKDQCLPKSVKLVPGNKQIQPTNDDVPKGGAEDNTIPKRGRESKYNRKEIREYIRQKRKQRQVIQNEEKQLQSATQSRSPPNYDRKDMKEYIEKRRKLRQMKAAEEQRLNKEMSEMKKIKLQQLLETAKQLIKKSAKKNTEEERPEWKGPLEEYMPDDEEEFVPEFKENIPASKRGKSYTRSGYVMKPVTSQSDVRANSQKNNLKTKSDEDITKTHKKGKDGKTYEILVGGSGDAENTKGRIADNKGDSKYTLVGKKSSALRNHGTMNAKQLATAVNNKITEDSQDKNKISTDKINLLNQIHDLKTTRKRNFRQPENNMAGNCNIECMQNYVKSKEFSLQRGIKANW